MCIKGLPVSVSTWQGLDNALKCDLCMLMIERVFLDQAGDHLFEVLYEHGFCLDGTVRRRGLLFVREPPFRK